MKRTIKVISIILLMIIITGCSRIYKLNQLAKIDNINIKAITAKKVANNTLEIVFEIKNNTKNTITISPEKNFKFYGINKVLIPNNTLLRYSSFELLFL